MIPIEWQWTMKKPQVPLAQGLHVIAVPLMQKNIGFLTDLPIKHVNGDIYFGKKEIKEIYNQIKEKISKDEVFPDKIKQKIEAAVEKLKSIATYLEKQNQKIQSNQELLIFFMKGYTVVAELTAFMSFKGTVQISDVLEEKVKHILATKITDPEKRTNMFLLLSLPRQNSFMLEEQNSILQIGAERQKGKEVEKELEEHTRKFSWVGCVMYDGKPYNKEHFRKELQEALKADCRIKLRERERKKQEREAQIKKALENLQLREEEKQIINQFRDWVHLRTYVKDMTSVGIVATIPFLEEIARRAAINYKDVLYLSHIELQNIFIERKELLVQESKERQNGWGFVLVNNHATYYNYRTVKEIEEKEEILPKGIKGFSACKGIARGIAIIVKNIEDLENVKEGNILIAPMTTTNFVPILSKVQAIVTDEGGITCHAAIISREMNIPCIIGTRLATKAFKSGDLIEVDAEKGIVRKIK